MTGRDERVLEPCEQLTFAPEACAQLIGLQTSPEQFDRNFAAIIKDVLS